MLVLKGLVVLHRTVQLQLLQRYWLGHRLGLSWYWMVCLGNEQRSFYFEIEELPHVRGQGWWPRGATTCLRSGAAAERSSPSPEVRGSGQEELPRARGQGRWPRGATPRPRSCGCAVAGGPRGATPCSRSGGAAMRRYPSSKVRSSGCALLEQPWRDTSCPR